MRDKLFEYVKKKYKTKPEYLWRRYPDYAIFRHNDNNKWFGLVMDVPREKLGLLGQERVDILNVKLSDPFLVDMLIKRKGFLKGYHISRGNWVSILLDGTVSFEEICDYLDESFLTTASKQKKEKVRSPKEWIVPANPKYYDIEHAFDNDKVINWKQGAGIKKGDVVFLYVASPISAILYKCKVTETDIPYDYQDDNLTIKVLMKIKLLKRYKQNQFTFDILKEEYGIYAARGARGVPHSLSIALNK